MHSNVPDLGRVKAAESRLGAVLVLDEIQKVTDWSNTVKFLWDRDTRAKSRLKVVLLGSSPLLVHRGLSESVAAFRIFCLEKAKPLLPA